MKRTSTINDDLSHVEAAVRDAVIRTHPSVVFTEIRFTPRKSWCGTDMIDVWAVYDGDVDDLAPPATPSLGTRVRGIFWDMGIDAVPSISLVSKSDAEELNPETV